MQTNWPPRYKPNFNAALRDTQSNNEESKLLAIKGLEDYKSDKEKELAFNALIPLIDDKNPRVRANAIVALSAFNIKEIINKIEDKLNDKDEIVVESALETLAKSKEEKVEEVLKKYINGKNYNLRLKSISLLCEYFLENNINNLIKILDDESDSEIRILLINNLSELNNNEINEKLMKLISDKNQEVKIEASFALAYNNIINDQIENNLIESLKIPEYIYDATLILGNYKVKKSVDSLSALFKRWLFEPELKALIAGALVNLSQSIGKKLLDKWISSWILSRKVSAVIAVGQFKLKEYNNKLEEIILSTKSKNELLILAMEVLLIFEEKELIKKTYDRLSKDKQRELINYSEKKYDENNFLIWHGIDKNVWENFRNIVQQ